MVIMLMVLVSHMGLLVNMSGHYIMADNGHHHCPCANNNLPQSFIGNHYYCEAVSTSCCGSASLYTSDPLWDGQGYYSTETACCSALGLPWFHRYYGNTTTSLLTILI